MNMFGIDFLVAVYYILFSALLIVQQRALRAEKNSFLNSWIGNEINPNWPEKLKRNDKISKSEELHKKNLNKLNFLLKNEIQDRINHHSNLQNLNLNFVIKSLDNDVFLIQN